MAPSAQPGTSQPPHSSNNSEDGNQQNSLAPKNRACPFCNQLFTSSSLGRHLDLYIKEKNPKAPDGVHDVDQIRKIRSQITRRHARTSTGKKQGSERARSPDSASDGGEPAQRASSPYVASNVQRPAQAASLPVPQFSQSGHPHPPSSSQNGALDFHRLKWQATGVINDIPPRAAESPRIDVFRETDQRQKLLEERDHGRAAELALREVLSQIQAAQVRLHHATLFPDFDFFACNLPSLCFKLLAPPPTLFSTTPVGTSDTWPVDGPPDRTTYEAIKQTVTAKIDDYHILHSSGSPDPTSPPSEPMTRQETYRFAEHLDLMWSQWSKLSDDERLKNWHLELLRIAAEERHQRLETTSGLEQARAEVQNLRLQLQEQAAAIAADASRPGSERNLWRAVAKPSGHSPMASVSSAPGTYVSNTLARTLSRGADANADSASRWDFHTLVGRWRETLRNGPLPQIFTSSAISQSSMPTPASTGVSADANGGMTPGGQHRDPSKPGEVGLSPYTNKRNAVEAGATDHHSQSRPPPSLRENRSSNGSPVKRDGV